jgi:hypothetical protein
MHFRRRVTPTSPLTWLRRAVHAALFILDKEEAVSAVLGAVQPCGTGEDQDGNVGGHGSATHTTCRHDESEENAVLCRLFRSIQAAVLPDLNRD